MTDVLPEVQRLIDRGWKVIRLEEGSKKPVESGWPDHDASADEFQPGENVGVKFGPASGGLTDIDLDFEQARKLIGRPVFGLAHLVEFGRSSQRAGERGHRLVICPDSPDRHRPLGIRGRVASEAMKRRGLKLTVLEVRGSHGSQTAFPPSVAKGDPLVWSQPGAEPPTMTWAELNRRVELLAVGALGAALYPSDEREAFCDLLAGALVEAGAPPPDANSMVAEVAMLCGDDENALRSPEAAPRGGLHDLFEHVALPEVEAPVRRWLGQDMPAEPRLDEQGEPGAFTADQLRRMLDALDPEDYGGYYAWRDLMFAAHHATGGSSAGCEVFVLWSARNPDYAPGKKDASGKLWSDVIRSAWKRTGRDLEGSSITVGTIFHELRENGHADVAAEFVRPTEDFEGDEVTAEFEPQKPSASNKDKERAALDAVRPREIDEMMCLPKPTWVVDGVVSEFALGQVIGVQKKGKTFFALDLALHIALGLEFHGHPVVRKRVVYIIAEGSPARFFDRVVAWCYEHDVELSALQGWFAVTYVKVKVDDRDALKVWMRTAFARKPGVVFIDTVARNMKGNESEAQDMGAFVDGADHIRESFDCAVLVLHHIGKDASKGGRGSSALPGAVDVTITVTQSADRRVTAAITEFREGAEGEKFIYEMVEREVDSEDMRTSVALRLVKRVLPGAKDGSGSELNETEMRILTLVKQRKGVARKAELVSKGEAGMSESNVGKAMKRLSDAGLLTPTSPYFVTPKGEEVLAGVEGENDPQG